MSIRSWFVGPAARLGLCVLVTCCGCGDGAADQLPRNAVSGSITLDGKPLESGMISFDPDSAEQAQPVSGGCLVRGGGYSLARVDGLTPGTYRVSIRSGGDGAALAEGEAPGAPPRKGTGDRIPDRYNAKSTLKAEVKGGGSARFDFELKSR